MSKETRFITIVSGTSCPKTTVGEIWINEIMSTTPTPPHPAAIRAAEKIKETFSITETSQFCDEVDVFDVKAEDIANIITREYEPAVRILRDIMTDLRWLRQNRYHEFEALIVNCPKLLEALDERSDEINKVTGGVYGD